MNRPDRDTPEYRAQHAAYMKDWYQRNKSKAVESRNRWRKKQSDWFEEFKKTLKCSRCPENDPACLDFHHKDPQEKEFSIGDMKRRGFSKERILQEAAKCDVLCSNCHRKHHYYSNVK